MKPDWKESIKYMLGDIREFFVSKPLLCVWCLLWAIPAYTFLFLFAVCAGVARLSFSEFKRAWEYIQ